MGNENANKPCPCGSGVKFKKCHRGKKYSQYENPNVPPEVIEAANRFSNPPHNGIEYGGFLTGRPFIDIPIRNNQQRARAVGSRVYIRSFNETFHEFILDLFGRAIDYAWIAKERIKPDGHRHTLSFWGQELVETMQKYKTDDGKPFGVKQSGNIRSLLSMAYDYYSLCHCSAAIQPNFIKRLKNKDGFQGARYEMAVAGIAVRAGFDIVWLNEKGKHCEFKGVHKITREVVYFESKSHAREGVLGKSGMFDPEKSRLKILDHFREAIEQSDKEFPLVIFDDLNLPISPDTDLSEIKWFKEIDESFEKYGFYKENKKTNYGAIFITNFSWHYHDSLGNIKENEVVAYFHTGGKYSLCPETVSLLQTASKQYGFVPAKLEERGIEVKNIA